MGFAYVCSSFSLPSFQPSLNHVHKEGAESKSNPFIFCFYKHIIPEENVKVLEVGGV